MTDKDTTKMTKAQRMHWGFGVDAYKMIEHDILNELMIHRCIPPGWDAIWQNEDRRDTKRQRVTIRLDDDVVKFFKGLGDGYQHRINRVLRMFMHFRLAGIIEGPDTTDFVLRPQTVVTKLGQRPKWGDFAAWKEEYGVK